MLSDTSSSNIVVQHVQLDVTTGNTSVFTSPGYETGHYYENAVTFWQLSSGPGTVRCEHIFSFKSLC